jgi:hypothetical protein
MEEIFKDIPNYEGMYQISNLGRIKSIDRKVKSRNSYRISKGKILKPSLDGFGYPIVSLSKNNIKKTKKIHILVCESFLNHFSCGFDIVIDHIDSNKQNNNLSNLRLVTQRENSSKERTIKSGLPVGVTVSKKDGKYTSRIIIKGKRLYLGRFKDVNEASKAYQKQLNNL